MKIPERLWVDCQNLSQKVSAFWEERWHRQLQSQGTAEGKKVTAD